MNTKLGMNVKIKLIKLGMTQTELAKKMKVSKQNLNGVLSGKSSSLQLEEKLIIWLKQPRKRIRTSGKQS
jgi:transcriptional regulator with XRE-family HTH domain